MSQWNEMDEVVKLALAQSVPAGPIIRSHLLGWWANSFYTRDWQEAALHYQEALEERRRLETESMAVAFFTNFLGRAVRNQGLLREAEEYYRKASPSPNDSLPGASVYRRF